MKTSTLNAVTKLSSRISNQSSLTSLYRSIEIGKETIRCCSEFGNIEIVTDETGLTEPVLLDSASVLGVTNNLPGDAEITLTPLEGKVNWKSGNVKGSLNIVQSDHAIPILNHTSFPWNPSPDLANALVLASSACQAAAVSVGLYGIVLEPEGDKLRLLSTNSVALASVTIDKGTYPTGKITIRPPVPGIIATFLSTCPNCLLDITNEGIFIQGDWLKAHLPVSSSLEHDLKEIADKYTLCAETATVNNAAVKMFITRARALADKNTFFTVGLNIEAGKLILRHASIASTTEEVFLCEGLDEKLEYPLVTLPADMLLISLPHIKTAVFDYLSESKLILKGTEPQFDYVIGGGEN